MGLFGILDASPIDLVVTRGADKNDLADCLSGLAAFPSRARTTSDGSNPHLAGTTGGILYARRKGGMPEVEVGNDSDPTDDGDRGRDSRDCFR